MPYVRLVVGLIAWLVIGALLFSWLDDYLLAPRAGGHRVAGDIWEFATAERRIVQLRLDVYRPLEAGDPIYRIEGPDRIQQVGEVRRVGSHVPGDGRAAAGLVAEVLLYPHAPAVCEGTYLTYYSTPRSLAWVLETMLPAEKRLKIAQEIVAAYESHHAEILEALWPVVMGGLAEAMEVVEQDFLAALARHREEWEALGTHYQDHVIEQEIVPLVRQEIWPIVRLHAEPLAHDIGRELLERASLWRFGWRALYDKSFLPEKNLTEKEWNRFVREEGLPVLHRHRSDMVVAQRRILENLADNPRVRAALRLSLTRMADDPAFRAIVWRVCREVLVDNPRLHQRLEQHWTTAEARRAVQLAAARVEPSVRGIGDLLLGTREDGISPEFAQVLRNQILDKDCRWLVIETPPDSLPLGPPPPDARLPVRLGGYPQVNPFAVALEGMK